MTAVFCSRGHPNPGDNRFCYLCGEKLSSRAMQQDVILGDRYRVVRELGHGGFGRTYLAEDINRFGEVCVLKEFAPQVQGTSSLEKAEELFEREAGILYGLQHSQIPRFRELFRAVLGDRSHLFLVQDYIPGETYGQLLQQRQQQGSPFTEPEVCQLLAQILPVLTYLHQSGVIHRDISPDNLILRSSDGLPVLIDFGGVKQISAVAESQFVSSNPETFAATRLGKLGYAPLEQMQLGRVSPQSDLYALAVTVLVLLSGEDPTRLLEVTGTASHWQQMISVSSDLRQILQRMLSVRPDDRFRSATDVLAALEQANLVPAPNQFLDLGSFAAIPNVATPTASEPSSLQSSSPQPTIPAAAALPYSVQLSPRQLKGPPRWFSWIILSVAVLALGGAGWILRDRWLPFLTVQGSLILPEWNRQIALQQRSQTLNVHFPFLVQLVNQTFYVRYPDQRGRTLSDDPQDIELRKIWNEIANEWLTLLENNLSETARQKLGRYTTADREVWKQQVNRLYVSSRSLFDLTDARFFMLFPEQQGQNFIDQPIGQVWQGMAADQVTALENKITLEKIQFATGTFSQQMSGSLAPGTGQVFLANLSEGQIMRLNIQAGAQSTLLSLYLPRPTRELPVLLEDSGDVTWTGKLPQSGYYEIVIVTRAKTPTDYQLNLAIDNVTSAPIEATRPEAPEAKN